MQNFLLKPYHIIMSYKEKIYTNNIKEYLGQKIKISGWLDNKRDHGSLLFFELRDFFGKIQVVIDNPSEESTKISVESIIEIEGIVNRRSEDTANNKIENGDIEITCIKVLVITKSDLLPFCIEEHRISDELKLKYRYLYMRNDKMKRNLCFRSDLLHFIRNYMHDLNFMEVQTPIITSSSPEGARDFLIPSRLHPGKFYAMPQAPQIFKQLLMVGGINKYYQVAPCFRDEDARKDRCYGEFWQLDLEMAFTTQEEVLDFACNFVKAVVQKFDAEKELTFTEITYKESLEFYGTDKPDLRYDLKSEDWTNFFAESEMQIFRKQVENGSIVKAFRLKNILSASKRDRVLKLCEDNGFKTGFVHKENHEIKGPIAKFINSDLLQNDEMLFFLCDKKSKIFKNLGILRNSLCELADLIDKTKHSIVKVIDFPMFEKNNLGQWEFTHNPFSKPQENIENKEDLSEVLAYQYDIVWNGYEVSSGSIRNNDVNSLMCGFERCGYTKEEILSKFNSLMTAFKYGAPPHGGCAFGLDRILMILLEEESIREIVAFPLNTNGYCPLTNAPTKINDKNLKELHIKTNDAN